VLSWRPPLRPSWGGTVNGQQRTDGMAASHSAAMPSSRDPGVAKRIGGVESGPERPPYGEEDGDEGDRRWESAGDSPRTAMGNGEDTGTARRLAVPVQQALRCCRSRQGLLAPVTLTATSDYAGSGGDLFWQPRLVVPRSRSS